MSTPTPPKLVDRLREAIRQRHYARTTEQTYIMWYKQFDSARPPARLTPRGAA